MTVAQRAAVESDAPNILCVAGPGSGKTTVITQRIRRLVHEGVDPAGIVAFTYTNAAARNLEERLGTFAASPNGDESVPYIDALIRLGYSGTIHGFCLRMLKQHGSVLGYGEKTGVIDAEASLELLTAKANLLKVKTPIKRLAELASLGRRPWNKGNQMTKDELVVSSYHEELREAGLLDFDLILTEFLRLVEDPLYHDVFRFGFSHLFVDERQDSSEVDGKIFDALPIPNKFSVGDPDQSLYGFRGGRPDLMADYSARPGVETLLLEANFRCRANICTVANDLICHNEKRIAKVTRSAVEGSGGCVVHLRRAGNEGEELQNVVMMIQDLIASGREPDEIAVLARSNAIANSFREAIESAGLRVAAAPKSDLPKDWALARAYVEFAAQPSNDTLAFFYLVAMFKHKDVGSDLDCRNKARDIQRDANRRGISVNEQWFKQPPGMTPAEIGPMLDAADLCMETQMIIAEKIKALPAGSGLTELALEVAKAKEPEGLPPSDGITVSTIHGAKGREWDVVFLVGLEDEVIPGTAKDRDVEEERRVLYVGITRARELVYLSNAGSRRATWGNRPIIVHKPSRFLAEVLP